MQKKTFAPLNYVRQVSKFYIIFINRDFRKLFKKYFLNKKKLSTDIQCIHAPQSNCINGNY